MRARAVLITGVVIATVAVLAACTPSGSVDPTTAQADPEPSSTPSPSATPTGKPFVMPTSCMTLLPQARLDSFAAEGLQLLGGPGGIYGEDYLLDPTPEEMAGGITCIWGDEAVPSSTVTVSIAPLSVDTRSGVVNDLIAQGLNEAPAGSAVTYSRLGDEVSSPAIVNVLRTKTWISVIEALGGEAFLDEAVTLCDEVAATVNAA